MLHHLHCKVQKKAKLILWVCCYVMHVFCFVWCCIHKTVVAMTVVVLRMIIIFSYHQYQTESMQTVSVFFLCLGSDTASCHNLWQPLELVVCVFFVLFQYTRETPLGRHLHLLKLLFMWVLHFYFFCHIHLFYFCNSRLWYIIYAFLYWWFASVRVLVVASVASTFAAVVATLALHVHMYVCTYVHVQFSVCLY